MRCILLRAIALLGLPLALAGCGRSPAEQAAVTTGRPSGTAIQLAGETSPVLSSLIDLKPEYESAAGIRVEIATRDRSDLLAALGAGADETPDLAVIPHHLLGQLVAADAIHPIKSLIDDLALFDPRIFDPQIDLLPWWREISQYQHRIYGYPASLKTMTLFYRKDLSRRLLVQPTTWRDIEESAELFPNPDQHIAAMAMNAKPEPGVFNTWLAHAYASGARIMDSPTGDAYGPIVVNSPEANSATERLVALGRLASGNPSERGLDDTIQEFSQGRAVFALLPHDISPRLERATDSNLAGGIGYIPLPSVTGRPAVQIDGYTFVIPSRSRHPREAFRVMQEILSNDVQILMARRGGLSARKSVYEDPRLKLMPYLASFRQMIDGGVPTPTIPEAQAIIDMMTPALADIVSGKVAPKPGLDALAAQLRELIERQSSVSTRKR